MKPKKGMLLRLAALAALTTVSLGIASPSHAAVTVTRNCSTSAQMCIHYNTISYGLNAEFGSNTNISSFNYNLNGSVYYRYKAGTQGSGGAGQTVWNNGGSGKNLSTWRNFAVFQNSNYQGNSVAIPYNHVANLGIVQNDNASMGWI